MTHSKKVDGWLLTVAFSSTALIGSISLEGPAFAQEPGDTERIAPRLAGLGEYTRPVTTDSEDAQAFFDQGLKLVYAFNHKEALRAFQEALRHDPSCAMASWGRALALGPNINAPITRENEIKAVEAIEQARARAEGATPVERDLIEALAKRYSKAEDDHRKTLDRAYADAMERLAERYPKDPDILTLYAAALMNLRPWDYYTKDGKEREDTPTIVATLERAIELEPDHPGALHYYIHAVEASNTPERAGPVADHLATLMPGAGHLVHMPSHIYIRTGRYKDAVEANEKAVQADEDYIAQCRAQGIYPLGYYPHNIHFLWASLMLEGRSAEAIEAGRKVTAKVPDEMMRDPENPVGGMLQLFKSSALVTYVRFGHWDKVLSAPEPDEDLTLLRGYWHYARGLAFVRQGELGRAQRQLKALRNVAASDNAQQMLTWNYNTYGQLLTIGAEVLAGELKAARGRYDAAVAHLDRAVRLEDALNYTEPPDWYFPVRQALGAILLEAGRADEAATVYYDDLRRNPENGWSLFGLVQALKALGRDDEAQEAEARFRKAWERADVVLPASRF